jgi:hypothetical protein
MIKGSEANFKLFNLQVLKMNIEIILENYKVAEETLDEI